jgi:hypothetical protein
MRIRHPVPERAERLDDHVAPAKETLDLQLGPIAGD